MIFSGTVAKSALISAVIAASSLVSADDDNVDPSALAISMEQATSIAEQQVEGTAISAEAESEHNIIIWEVDVVDSQGTTYEVEIDASNGNVLEVEKDD